jgi:alkyldihydroxyacetonephosphate synthase
MSDSPDSYPDFRPFRWESPGQSKRTDTVAEEILQRLGFRQSFFERAEPYRMNLKPPRIAPSAMAAFRNALSPENVDAGPRARSAHADGYSTLDLLRHRLGDGSHAPDAVLYPTTHEQVMDLLAVASDLQVAVVPFGGGTSVVGGLTPSVHEFRGCVALDLRRLDQLLGVDAVTRTVTAQAGMPGARLEAELAGAGYTLGHFPQSFERGTIGGYAATRSAGQASTGYGRFDELVTALTVATPSGTVETGTAPRSAAGPDLRQLFLGSEGTLGIITGVTARIRPAPEQTWLEGWSFDTFEAGVETLRTLAQDGPTPTIVRLSDEYETMAAFPGPPARQGRCVAVVGFEGSAHDVEQRRKGAQKTLAGSGTSLGTEIGEQWNRSRYQGPGLRDALLDRGLFVETLETAAFWPGIIPLHQAIRAAIQGALREDGTPSFVTCHISHIYETGASLYFTVLCEAGRDPFSRWEAAYRAAGNEIITAKATCTHHHGVGSDHRGLYHREIGPVALEALRAVKRSLDPQGILNPGILV